MLIDEVEIIVKAGDGGAGAVSFRRNAQTARGGPDGGNGGNGGSVYFQGQNDSSLLQKFQFKKEVIGQDGVRGKGNNLYGKNADDLIVKVPIGTLVKNLENNEIFEILSEDKVLVASGGIGGKGNNSFKSATNQSPKYAEKGTRGEEKRLKLTLRLIADVGFVGLPNAGKSSALKALTNANPKIGDYPFTTLEPNLGALDKIILADIPGLIEGASTGKGLGTNFLKHIEKTKIIVHFISLENSDLLKAYEEVNLELSNHDSTLPDRTKLIVITKTDLFDNAEVLKKVNDLKDIDVEILTFSVYDNNGVEKLKERIYSKLNEKNKTTSTSS